MRLRYLWPGIVWIGIILFLTGLPGQYIPKIPGFMDLFKPDKLVHAFIFLVLVILLLFGIEKQNVPIKHWRLNSLLILLFSILFGGGTELLQKYLFINRTADWTDFVADGIGALLGYIVYFRWFIKPTLLKKTLEKIAG
jgi:VanZ family protein